MTFDEYVVSLPSHLVKITPTQRLILKTLWADDETPFPKPWIKATTILAVTEQSEYARRKRDCVLNFGCDIESGHFEGVPAYRLASSTLKPANPAINSHDHS